MLLEKVQAILKNPCSLDPHDTLIAGISGGADSMVLLDLLVRSGFRPLVAHFNHQLREQAAADADFVQARAADYSLEYVLGSADVGAQALECGQSLEEAARNARYGFLFDLAAQRGAAALVVAHQADDQVETVLMNLLRGSGLDGLSGMQYRSYSPFNADIPLVRPLLGCWREEIEAYARQNDLHWMEDATNKDSAYRRNRIRLELLPELESYNPQIRQAIWRMADLLAADRDFMREAVAEAAWTCRLQVDAGYAQFDLSHFRQYAPAVQRSLVRRILAEAFPLQQDLGAQQVEQARRCLNRETTSLKVNLNDAVQVRVEQARGVFLRIADAALPAKEWPSLAGEMDLPAAAGQVALSEDWGIQLELIPREVLGDAYRQNADNYCSYLAVESLASQLHLRTWRAGDRYYPLGMYGQQKVSDFWVNQKVPLRAKGHWPLLFSDEELVWIPGFAPAESARVREGTQQILKIRVYRTND
ncbi:MAG: tRNA(Ile)-lysidine synthase [Chloroflexota bacterium]|nr:tRNA(Ile)-lysidine synthase [Chloroflexota bacterium]